LAGRKSCSFFQLLSYRIYNIGNDKPTKVLDIIGAIEQSTGIAADKKFKPMQPVDVVSTTASIEQIKQG
jgi:UDP-glucuronate 4-epimerase